MGGGVRSLGEHLFFSSYVTVWERAEKRYKHGWGHLSEHYCTAEKASAAGNC